jgi:hypothetical protein
MGNGDEPGVWMLTLVPVSAGCQWRVHESYADDVRRHILEPLGMDASPDRAAP